MLKENDRARPAARWLALLLAAACVGPAAAASRGSRTAAKPAPQVVHTFTPTVTITTQVFTPQGEERMYPVAAGKESTWQPGMPIYIGDRLHLNAFVSTGAADLKEVRVRLDNEPLTTITQAPWSVDLDTENWQPGYHFVEMYGQSRDASAPSGSATAVYFAREPLAQKPARTPDKTVSETTTGSLSETVTEEPSTAVAASRETPESVSQPPAHPGQPVPTNDQGAPQYPAALATQIRSRDTTAEKEIEAHEVVRVTQPTLFYVTAGPEARHIIYALTRNGREIFRSEALPVNSLVRLQPKAAGQPVGLNPGEVTLWIWAGNDKDIYGAPDMVRVEIAPQS